MTRLEERQAEMLSRFASSLSQHIHQPWEDYSVNQTKMRCESCNTPFITVGSRVCGQCQARAKKLNIQ
jgi:rubrerythrin